ncbi:MAG: endonuclease [Bacteroidota bacterium]|nr:endonuclease [Bacteroidota bacterium]
MKKLFTLFTFISTFYFAQIPPGYYNSAQGLSGNNLKIALYNIIKNHSQITYAGLWSAFPQTDAKANGKVWDIYSHNPTGAQPYEYTFVTNQCGSYNSEADCYNREHSWPQSWFNSTIGPDSDLFHIYPTDGEVNGKRSNFPYGNVSNPTWTSMNGSKLGPCTNAGYTSTVFEPINEYKGDLARSYFYMSTRYYSEDATWSSSTATNKATILPWELNVLLQWHHQDPVSAKEIARNNKIYTSYQNNRNPFIDNPQWADSIWVSTVSGFKEENKFRSSFSIYPNPANNYFEINYNSYEQQDYLIQIKTIDGKLIEERNISLENSKRFDCSSWANGVYFISVSNANSKSNFKFLKVD